MSKNKYKEQKVGNRNNANDRERIRKLRQMANDFVSLTLELEPTDIDLEDVVTNAAEALEKTTMNKKIDLKAIKDMGGYHYAQQEAWDIQGASQAIISISNLVSSEISCDEPNHVSQLAEVMRGLVKYIEQEIDEMVSASKEGTSDGYAMLNTTVTDNPASDSKSATDVSHPAQVKTVETPLKLDYVKSLGLEIPENKLAVKYVGKNTIAHPVFIWGDAKKTDLEIEFFNRQSDFWDEVLKDYVRPLTWDHGQDELFAKFENNPVIGKTVKYYDDDIARWAESVIETDKQYRKYLDQFISEKRLGYSSDSAPQYVQRVKQGKAIWLKSWPWFGGSLTAQPCEPRMKVYTPEFIKSLGIALPDSPQDWQADMAILDFIKFKNLGE